MQGGALSAELRTDSEPPAHVRLEAAVWVDPAEHGAEPFQLREHTGEARSAHQRILGGVEPAAMVESDTLDPRMQFLYAGAPRQINGERVAFERERDEAFAGAAEA